MLLTTGPAAKQLPQPVLVKCSLSIILSAQLAPFATKETAAMAIRAWAAVLFFMDSPLCGIVKLDCLDVVEP
jgi:hypothetical protein